MFCVDGLKQFMARMHFHVPSIDVLMESLKTKHDAQHFAFTAGVVIFCFGQRLTDEFDVANGLQQSSYESSTHVVWFVTVNALAQDGRTGCPFQASGKQSFFQRGNLKCYVRTSYGMYEYKLRTHVIVDD